MVKSPEIQEHPLWRMRPVILIGMHRSGTSLTARLLKDLGIHMGSWLSRDAESVFFQRLNRRVLAAAGVKSWGQVETLVEAMRSQAFVERQTEAMRKALFHDRHIVRRGKGLGQFFGRDLWKAVCQDDPVAWGWKDPRTTLTFPIWIRLFPHARCVHVLRNGIDVAISTHRRSKKQQRKLSRRVLRLDYSPITLDFDYCFRLWETHVSFVLDHQYLIPPHQFYEVRFEDLLADSETQLRRLTDFLEYPVEEEVLAVACKQINSSRLDNSVYAAEYQDEIPALLSKPLMQQLGYG